MTLSTSPARTTRTTRTTRVATAAWSGALVTGALALRAWDPEALSPVLARVLRAEPVHVVAHLALYGVLTALCHRLTRGRVARALALVALVALAQEAAQTLPFARAPGWPELFDLAVDAVAAAAVLVARRRRAVADASRRAG